MRETVSNGGIILKLFGKKQDVRTGFKQIRKKLKWLNFVRTCNVD